MKKYLLSIFFLANTLRGGGSVSAASASLPDSTSIVNEDLKKDSDELNYVLDLELPKIVYADEEVEYDVNLQIQQIVGDAISGFKNKIKNNTIFDPSNPSKLQIRYSVKKNSQGYLSLLFEKSAYFTGKRFTYHSVQTLNYNLIKKESLPLVSFLGKSPQEFEAVKALYEKIKKTDCGKKLDMEDFKGFYILPDELVIVAPNKWETQESCKVDLKISWTKLLPQASPNDILNTFADTVRAGKNK